MRRALGLGAGSLLCALSVVHADPGVAVSSAPPVALIPAPSASTSPVTGATPPTVIASTATIPDRAMTAPPKDIFLTLTRSAYPTSDLPTSAERITPSTFEKFNAQNAGEAVSRATSVQTLATLPTVGGPLMAGIRGAPGEQTLVLVDGRPYEGFALGPTDLSEIPIESIDHIEILRGGSSALYGPNAMGGVINILTKRAAYEGKPVSDFSYYNGPFGGQAYRLNAASRWRLFDYAFYGDQQRASGFRNNSDARSYNIGGNLGVSMGHAGKFIFDASSYEINAGVPGPNPYNLPPNQFDSADERAASTPNARQTTTTNYVRTSYLLPLPHESLMTLRLFGMQRQVQYNDQGDFAGNVSDRQEQSKGGEAQFNLPLGFTVGGNFLRDRESNSIEVQPQDSFTNAIENWSLFAQDEFHYETLTLIPSGRYDHNSQAGESKNPRVQLIDDVLPWFRLSGSAAHSFRAPTLDELYSQISDQFTTFHGNPDLQPETAWTYDAGFEVHEGSYSFQTTYFRANVDNLIQVQPMTMDTVVNVGTARRQGAEVQAKEVLNDVFTHSINYTYLDNSGIPAGYTNDVNLAYSPHNTINYFQTITPAKRWTIEPTVKFEGTRWSGNDQTGTELGSQVLFDARVAYQLRQASFYIGAQDLFNKRYENVSGYPMPGRAIYGGMTLRLWE